MGLFKVIHQIHLCETSDISKLWLWYHNPDPHQCGQVEEGGRQWQSTCVEPPLVNIMFFPTSDFSKWVAPSKRMNFRKSSNRPLIMLIFFWKIMLKKPCLKSAIEFFGLKMTTPPPFGAFPKINLFWRRHSFLTTLTNISSKIDKHRNSHDDKYVYRLWQIDVTTLTEHVCRATARYHSPCIVSLCTFRLPDEFVVIRLWICSNQDINICKTPHLLASTYVTLLKAVNCATPALQGGRQPDRLCNNGIVARRHRL